MIPLDQDQRFIGCVPIRWRQVRVEQGKGGEQMVHPIATPSNEHILIDASGQGTFDCEQGVTLILVPQTANMLQLFNF